MVKFQKNSKPIHFCGGASYEIYIISCDVWLWSIDNHIYSARSYSHVVKFLYRNWELCHFGENKQLWPISEELRSIKAMPIIWSEDSYVLMLFLLVVYKLINLIMSLTHLYAHIVCIYKKIMCIFVQSDKSSLSFKNNLFIY